MLTPAAALFDGDAPRLDVCCGEATDVTLTTTAATKLNRCDRSHISLEVHLSVGRRAMLRYLPHELIPFEGASYAQRIDVDLEEDASAWLLEVVGPGASGAQFTYTRLAFETNVRQRGDLLARERFVLTPESAAQLRGYSHYGSLLAFGPGYERATATALNARLACAPSPAQVAASALPTNGVAMKMLGTSAQSVRHALLESADCPAWLTVLLPA
jgi:urease accessory protein